MKVIKTLELPNGGAPYEDWVSSLDFKTKNKILDYVSRLSSGGSKKNIKPLGDKLFELKINYGPGYRVYFVELAGVIYLIVLGGDKSTQRADIKKAKEYWRAYAIQNKII